MARTKVRILRPTPPPPAWLGLALGTSCPAR